MKISLILATVLLSISVVNSLVLIIKPEKTAVKNKMLGYSLLFFNIFLLLYFLMYEAGYVLEFPHLLRSASPLMYLSAPFFYFYIRNNLQNLQGFKKLDWIHFLPAMIHALELLPFYLLSTPEKLQIAQEIVNEPFKINFLASGLVPISFHYPFRSILQVLYLGYSFNLVRHADSKRTKGLYVENLKSWFYVSIFLMAWVVLAHFGYSVFSTLKILGAVEFPIVFTVFSRIALIGILILNIYITVYPELVHSFQPHSEASKNGELLIQSNGIKVGDDDILIKKGDLKEKEFVEIGFKIDSFLDTNGQFFTEKSLSLDLFSKKIGYPSKVVSQVIHKKFGKGFNEWVNFFRVRMALTLIQDGFLDTYTIDSLSDKVGFNSRITFFNAFKKEVGWSPNEYWKKFLNGEISIDPNIQ